MQELAKEIESVEQQSRKETLAEVAALSVVLIDALNRLAKKESITVVGSNGNARDIKRSILKTQSLSQLRAEIVRFEKVLSASLYAAIMKAMTNATDVTANALKESIDNVSKLAKVNVDRELGKKVTIGDKTLEQRTRIISTGISTDVQKAIRQGVLGGEDIDVVIANVRKSIDDYTWEMERIIESEVWNAYRYQFGQTASENGFDWIRIHESFPRHPNRRKHKCYPLANADKYGKGKGVYKSTDTEIFYPHPQCTSWLEVVEALD